MIRFSDLIILVITGVVLCLIGYGIYRWIKYLQAWDVLEKKRQKELQESLASIADKNLGAVMVYLHEKQKQSGMEVFIFIFILMFLCKR